MLTFGWLAFYVPYGPFFCLPSTFLRGTAVAGGLGLFNTFGGLGGFFGPSLFGVLRQGSGTYATALAVASFGLVLTSLIVLSVGRTIASRRAIIQPSADSAA